MHRRNTLSEIDEMFLQEHCGKLQGMALILQRPEDRSRLEVPDCAQVGDCTGFHDDRGLASFVYFFGSFPFRDSGLVAEAYG